MKKLMMIPLVLSFFVFSGNVFADGALKQAMDKKEENKTSKKKSRRKKVQMCQECGKPEPECECEGEGHGAEHVEGHDEHKAEEDHHED
jgi:hypothetical protein